MPDTPLELTPYERRLVESALRYYGNTMPGYAAAASLTKEEYGAVMKDVRAARRLVARLTGEEPRDAWTRKENR
jgi:hypothetical protein